MSRPEGPTEEIWSAHKQDIYRYYIVQRQTLKATMEIMRNCHQFYASQTQFTTQLAAWGFVKNNKAIDYPGIIGGVKRRGIDLDEIESVTIVSGSVEKVLSKRQVKKGWARCKRVKMDTEPLDAPSPPGFAIQCRQLAQGHHFKAPQYPFLTFIKELTYTLRLPNSYSSEAYRARQDNQNLFHQFQTSFDFGRERLLDGSKSSYLSPPLLELVSEECKSISAAQSMNLEPLFQATFMLSNNTMPASDAIKLGEWLSLNVNVRTLCRFRSWAAKLLLTCLLHGAVKMDAVAVLRAAHLRGVDLESPASFGYNMTLLQRSLLYGSIQCSRYLIENGADVSVSFFGRLYKPLLLASESKQCVDLVPTLLNHGASLDNHCEHLLGACIDSGATAETIKSLIDSGISPSEQGGLSKAASLGRLDIMELLISAGASIEGPPFTSLPSTLSSEWETEEIFFLSPGAAATASGCVDALEFLMCHGLDLNATLLDKLPAGWQPPCHFSFDMYPIQHAVRNGDCDLVKYLFERGASITPRYGSPLLVLAAKNQDVSMMTLLLELGADASSVLQTTTSCGTLGETVSALGEVSAEGCLPGMQLLINAGSHIDFCGSTEGSRTPLQRAAANGHISAVEMLLDSGADINAPPCPVDGISTLQALIKCEDLALIVRAISAGASVHPSLGEIGSPLCAAVTKGEPNLVSLLIRLGANVSQPSMYENGLYYLPLQLAAEKGHLDICKILIQAKADIDGTVRDDHPDHEDFYYYSTEERTPLTIACNLGNKLVVEYLISQHASLHGKTNNYNLTPLYWALNRGEVEIVRLLLQHDVDPNYFCFGCICNGDLPEKATPLSRAVECFWGGEYRVYQLVELLIQYGADPNYGPSLSFLNPLQIACYSGWSEVAKLLLSHGANVNTPNPDMGEIERNKLFRYWNLSKMSALLTAVFREKIEIVELLLSRGADVHTPMGSTMRFTALQAAAWTGNVEIAAKLLQAGARVDEPPADHDEGGIAIQFAAKNGRLEMLGLLLSNYRGTRSITEICDDAAKFALKKKYSHIVGYLQEYKKKKKWSWEEEEQEEQEDDSWAQELSPTMMEEFLGFD